MLARASLLSLLCKAHADAEAPAGVVAETLTGHPWPHPGDHMEGWPTFKDKKELEASPWGKYYELIYGELPDTFPVHPGDLWILYDEKLKEAKVEGKTHIPEMKWACPDGVHGSRYKRNSAMQPEHTSFVWHPYPWHPIPSHEKVEITHERAFHGDSAQGSWMMYAPGTGIYFNLGKTIPFKDHPDCAKHFGVPYGNWQTDNPKMAAAARKKGYDSIQFLAHTDAEYPCSERNKWGRDHEPKSHLMLYLGVEILSTKLFGDHSCMQEKGTPHEITHGWGGHKECHCDHNEKFVNCNGKGANMLLNSTSVTIV